MTNGLQAIVKFDTKQNNRTSYLASFFVGSDKPDEKTGAIDARSDLFSIEITDALGKKLSEGSGSWLENV